MYSGNYATAGATVLGPQVAAHLLVSPKATRVLTKAANGDVSALKKLMQLTAQATQTLTARGVVLLDPLGLQ